MEHFDEAQFWQDVENYRLAVDAATTEGDEQDLSDAQWKEFMDTQWHLDPGDDAVAWHEDEHHDDPQGDADEDAPVIPYFTDVTVEEVEAQLASEAARTWSQYQVFKWLGQHPDPDIRAHYARHYPMARFYQAWMMLYEQDPEVMTALASNSALEASYALLLSITNNPELRLAAVSNPVIPEDAVEYLRCVDDEDEPLLPMIAADRYRDYEGAANDDAQAPSASPATGGDDDD